MILQDVKLLKQFVRLLYNTGENAGLTDCMTNEFANSKLLEELSLSEVRPMSIALHAAK